MNEPLTPVAGRGIVVGQITVSDGDAVVPPTNPGADWSAAGLRPRPELRVYLVRLGPRAVTLPAVRDAGFFAWSLAPGDYLLLALPEEDVGSPSQAMRFRPVAALRVLPGGPWCAGSLGIDTAGPVVLDSDPPRVDPAVTGATVTDRCESLGRDITTRYAPLEQPFATCLMVAADDLAFEDAALPRRVRARLDAMPCQRAR